MFLCVREFRPQRWSISGGPKVYCQYTITGEQDTSEICSEGECYRGCEKINGIYNNHKHKIITESFVRIVKSTSSYVLESFSC